MDTGLLILRVVAGLLLAGHGAQKLFGSFGGHGLDGVGGWFHSMGFRPGRPMAVTAGMAELVGGLLLALGFLTPFAGAAVVGTMVVAASVHRTNGVWATAGGYELALLYGVVGLALATAGPGEASVDAWLDLDDTWSAGLGLVLCALALVAGLVLTARASKVTKADAEAIDLRDTEAVPAGTTEAHPVIR
jgi:putative oxidoreductase